MSNPNIIAIAITFGVALFISGAMIFFKMILGPKHTNPAKEIPFECGMVPVGSPRKGVHVRYFLVAILFIIFDIEVIFIYPWAVHCRDLGVFGFWQMFIFLSVLMLGLFYIVRKGVFAWK